jgi:hypothetical protein
MNASPPPPEFNPYEVFLDDPFSPGFSPSTLPYDFHIIDKVFDPLTSWIQKWTARDSFDIAKAVMKLFPWLNVISIAIIAKHVLVGHNQSIICALITAAYCLQSYLKARLFLQMPEVLDNLRDKVMNFVAENGTKNPIARSFNRKYLFIEGGFLYLVYSPGFILHDESDMILKTIIVGRYPLQYLCMLLMACTPNRPSKSKFRDLFDSAKEKIANAIGGLGGQEHAPA